MGTDLRRLNTVLDPIRAHPRNPWLKQALRSISRCHPFTILEVLSFHDVTVVISCTHIGIAIAILIKHFRKPE